MKSILMLCAFVFAAAVSLSAPLHAMAAQPLVTVPLDVDVYDQPGGVGKPREGFLPAGSKVALLDQRDDDWCHVSGDAVPGKEGWVWCGVNPDGTSYKLTADSDGTPIAPVKHDCEDIGPNEQAGGGSSDPNEKFECEKLENGGQHCCWVTYPPQQQ
jgi:hypothetical protein